MVYALAQRPGGPRFESASWLSIFDKPTLKKIRELIIEFWGLIAPSARVA